MKRSKLKPKRSFFIDDPMEFEYFLESDAVKIAKNLRKRKLLTVMIELSP